ncbi:hypothetical protein KGO95_01715 [Patescibacteria group bacterium]|nr:hypothetical protein [Patescibacteria group bacterium]
MDSFLKTVLQPASILSGTIIGAGVFALPYIFAQVGVRAGLIGLVLCGVLFGFLYYVYGDVIARTAGEHRFVGYARTYLGKPGFLLALFVGFFELIVILAIYLILAPSFSQLIVGGAAGWHLLAFWIIASAVALSSNRKMAFLEFLIVAGIVMIMALLFILGIPKFSPALISGVDWKHLWNFAIVGPILFSLSGSLAVPEIIRYFHDEKIPVAFFRRTVWLGMSIAIVAYAAFVLGVLSLSPAVSSDAVSGLRGAVAPGVLAVIGVLGILSLLSSYIVAGLNVRHIVEYDLGLPRLAGAGTLVAAPLLLYMAGLQNFMGAVSFAGSIFLPLESILIIFMWMKMRRQTTAEPVFSGVWTLVPAIGALVIFVTILFYAILK